ncbi:MAG TPA: HYR domain-containing protein, partial [Saprospiraceae bacterium]|nr:HYR domain-containing protein [Saprospiraceae bacterium]
MNHLYKNSQVGLLLSAIFVLITAFNKNSEENFNNTSRAAFDAPPLITVDSQVFNYSGTIDNFVVPDGVTSLTIKVRGAQGGSVSTTCSATGGLGAEMIGDFAVTPGESLMVLVGQQGLSNGSDAGGGGGSFVVGSGNTPLIIAGGGGGATNNIRNCGSNLNGIDASITTSGTASANGLVAGGTGGNGGGASSGSGGGGGGFFTDGTAGTGLANNNGKSFLHGGIGGTGNNNDFGGFGGGGAGWFTGGNGGGGGGYSGGGTSGSQPYSGGGGGGSFNAGTNQVNIAGVQSGNGKVVICWVIADCDTPSITCPSNITIMANPFACEVPVSYADPTVESDCIPTITRIAGPASGSLLDLGTSVVTFVASNPPANNDTCSFTITVLENGQGQPLQSTAKRAAAGLACHDHVNISLGSDCLRTITARDVLVNGSAGCIDRYNCNVFLPNGLTPIPGATLTYENVGQTLTYVVEDIQSGGKCWGTLKLEDKLGPQIYCQNDTISCLQMGEREDLVVITDLCQPFPTTTNILEKQWTDLGCDDREFIGFLARKVRATDVWGNYAECRDTLFVRKETIDSLVCGPDTLIECTTEVVRNGKTVELLWNAGKDGDTYLDAQGYAHPWPTKGDGYFPAPYLKSTQPGQDPGYLLPLHTDSGPDFTNTGKCQIVFDYEDHIVPTCGKSYKIRRTWHVYDWCGHSDTTCVQWFKITDTQSPQIDPGHLNIFDNLVSSADQIHTCDFVPESVIQEARSKQAWLACEVLEAEVDPHDCKATVILPDPRDWVLKDCDDQLDVYYEIEYVDPTHPGKVLLESGNIAEGSTAHVYLPAGWHNVVYHIRDRCWNETLLLQGINVYDNTPPVPVCDEITQVTLDPEKCWARVYAKDLDDGSHDNCCDQLHFAVASMDSITYWRQYWEDYYASCLDPYDYHHYNDLIQQTIEEWINVFVFDDYIDVTECGSEQLVLRVYEACDVPVYDPHIFYGGEHEWYWWHLSNNFARWYYWRLNDYIHYGDPRAALTCTAEVLMPALPAAADPVAYNISEWDIPLNIGLCAYPISYLEQHGSFPSGICAYFIPDDAARKEWESRVRNPYPTDVSVLESLSASKRHHFPHLYNDCMIEVRKDDKTPPVVVAPEDVTVYCDGVPYWWELTKSYAGGTKTATVKGHGASFTHDVCEGEDALATYCADPYIYPIGRNTSDAPVEVTQVCCVEIPWDGGDFGYYGGSVCGEYSYAGGVNCDEYNYWYESHNWQPIYCRLWLMLDKYDN